MITNKNIGPRITEPFLTPRRVVFCGPANINSLIKVSMFDGRLAVILPPDNQPYVTDMVEYFIHEYKE